MNREKITLVDGVPHWLMLGYNAVEVALAIAGIACSDKRVPRQRWSVMAKG